MLEQLVELLFSISLFANGLLFLPQAWALYKQKNSQDVSLLTFVGFATIQFFTICHAYLVSDHRLMLGVIFSFILCNLVNALIIFYRIKNR